MAALATSALGGQAPAESRPRSVGPLAWRTDLAASEYAAAAVLNDLRDVHAGRDERLHLSTSMRSFRSERVSAFVKALLDCDVSAARELLRDVSRRYPIAITRDLPTAKQWVRERARGSERYGVRVNVDAIHWFLNDRHDTRSSYYLEDAATEFQVQGLELDWICVTSDADLRLVDECWRYHAFRGDTWTTIHKVDRQRYLLNAYRVLLTRARQGMVIFVPPGDESDPTRAPGFSVQTFDYLTGLGMRELSTPA